MTEIKAHPVDGLLRTDRIPHIWCPGCGVGTSVNCFTRAIEKVGMDLDKLHVVSGIGCTGRVAGYINVDSFHTTHGRALAFATGLSLSRPDSKVVVYSGDGDLTAIGGNHLIHAARRNVDMTVICVNNYTYGMTGGQVTPTTPDKALASTAPFGNYEYTFNVPHLAVSSGATYVARWTVFHVRQLTRAMTKALRHKGFSFIEVLSPCPTLYMRRNKLGAAVNLMEYFKENAVVQDGADTATVGLESGETIIGEFVNVRKPTLKECYEERMSEALGDEFVPYEGDK
ncbi:MAG: 2-oxoacid:ferredoxin oxidoreductase subunit beta [Deltaproteobacteria bacterium]|nr:2-oxoacid:ferredoxin oxidoreductase subunit beta [Deltaproteobacteria bacterium]MBN2674330.1 2-oxoacid:ferredoxin oxidoreductase subunit beta [Deltaproteobacteria bacterium]